MFLLGRSSENTIVRGDASRNDRTVIGDPNATREPLIDQAPRKITRRAAI